LSRPEVLTVDENGMRTLLRDIADTETPPARVDLDQAIAAGGRQRRARLAGAGGSVLAAGAAIAVAVAVAVAPNPKTAPAMTSQSPAAAVTRAPAQFDPLVPYAAFGWLPAGYVTGVEEASMSTTRSIQLAATHPNGWGLIQLTVDAKGACTGSPPKSLTCPGTNDDTLYLNSLTRAPDVNGRPAYWAAIKYKAGVYLAWQYAPGAWAALEALTGGPVTYADRTQLERVAAHVRYDQRTPLTVSFWVRLPAGWTAGEAAFSPGPSGTLDATQVSAGPADDPQAVDMVATPSSGAGGCKGTPNTTLDGTPATLLVSGNPPAYQSLCAADVDGVSVYTAVYYALITTGDQPVLPGGALALAKDMHLLGSRVSDWTNHPLR
jgi:hypothetical protein